MRGEGRRDKNLLEIEKNFCISLRKPMKSSTILENFQLHLDIWIKISLKDFGIPLDLYRDTWYSFVTRYSKGVKKIADKSRAEYFKKRRESQKTFSVVLERGKLEKFESKLQEQKRTKTEWLNEKIDEELGK